MIKLKLSKWEIDILARIVCDREFDTDSDHPLRLRLDHNFENSGGLPGVLRPSLVNEVISTELLASGLLTILELLDSEGHVCQVIILGRAPGLLGNTQVEHALWVRVHVLGRPFLQSDRSHFRVLHKHNS